MNYKLKKEIFFEDENSVGKDVVLRILKEDSDLKLVQLETVSNEFQNVKKIFWTEKDNIEQIN
tara:strand:+ start:1278 stop:1466 length:189 start_codon:yes stop_codon:yes gene_type:complete